MWYGKQHLVHVISVRMLICPLKLCRGCVIRRNDYHVKLLLSMFLFGGKLFYVSDVAYGNAETEWHSLVEWFLIKWAIVGGWSVCEVESIQNLFIISKLKKLQKLLQNVLYWKLIESTLNWLLIKNHFIYYLFK